MELMQTYVLALGTLERLERFQLKLLDGCSTARMRRENRTSVTTKKALKACVLKKIYR